MATKNLTVKLSEDLYGKFIETVTEKGGRWRGGETFTGALESAVAVALMLFLQNLDRDIEMPEFSDCIEEKHPELDEDLIEPERERVTLDSRMIYMHQVIYSYS
ncbi:MAG: hypothetical protein PHU23_15105 [Dehalococcoidales bacterium]|nr:hypothetical protein [Dehalococcoidales bacterium]